MIFDWLRRRKQAEVRARPFPPAWRELIAKNVPLAARLDPAGRAALEGLVAVFLEDKAFEGCGGQVIDDEVRVTIAAQACLLLVGRGADTDPFPRVRTVLVYPSAWLGHGKRQEPDGTVIEGGGAHLGEAWKGGPVIVAWDDARSGVQDGKDGQNVVLHEFAHALDAEDGPVDGAPRLPSRARYTAWAAVFSDEYRQLVDAVHADHRTVLDPYGATSPAEFFAVVTETFFEKGKQLKRKHPALYEQLRAYFGQDPAGA